MNWIFSQIAFWFQWFCFKLISSGVIPKHVAIIMDGNRRYGRMHCNNQKKGHGKGYRKLLKTLKWCIQLGIKEVTVYAFSIENFKRSEEEVQYLMNLFKKVYMEKPLANMKAHVDIFGNLNLFDSETRGYIAATRQESTSLDQSLIRVNFAVAYTSRDEIKTAIQSVVKGVEDSRINTQDIDELLITQCMFTNRSHDIDLLIRTSGVFRLSDFLLWQISATNLIFSTVLWPTYHWMHLWLAVFMYQRDFYTLQKIKNVLYSRIGNAMNSNDEKRRMDFIQTVNRIREEQFDKYYLMDYKQKQCI